MKKSKLVMLGLTFAMAPAVLVACGDAEVTVDGVSTDYFKTTYYYEEATSIDFSKVNVTVRLSDGTTTTLNAQGLLDTDFEDAGENPNFDYILKTGGLAQDLQNNSLQLDHDYEISCILKKDKKEYKLATVMFKDDLSIVYDLTRFLEPKAVETFKTQVGSTTEESKFMKKETKYYVGDDNGFKLAPRYTFVTKEGDPVSNVHLSVNAQVYKVNGNEQTLVQPGTDYTFDGLNYTFQFADTAVGYDYLLKLTPKDFTEFFNGSQIQPIELEVSVADGYNVYSGYDLGHIAVVGAEDQAAVRGCQLSSYDRFYNEDTHQYTTKYYYEVWNNFYTEHGETNLKTVNGIFLHDDIKVEKKDVPEEYFVTATENAYAANSLRDWSFVYPHHLPNLNTTFTFNGNCFKIDMTEFPVALNHDHNDALEYYNENTTIDYLTNSVFFFFAGQHHTETDTLDPATFANVVMKNVYATGASGKTITGDVSEHAAGTPTFYKAESTVNPTLENSVINQFMIGLNSSQKGDWVVKDTKIFDCYNTGLYVYVANGKIENSQLKRFGGPVVFSVSELDGTTPRWNTFEIDDASILENFVTADQTWFTMNHAETFVQLFQGLSLANNPYGLVNTRKTILNDEGKFNMQVLVLDADYLGANHGQLFTEVVYPQDIPVDYNSQIMEFVKEQARSYMAAMMSQQYGYEVPVSAIPDPIIIGDQYGHFAVADDEAKIQAYITVTKLDPNDPEFEVSMTTPVDFVGDALYIYCPTPGAARAGMVVQLFDVPAQA